MAGENMLQSEAFWMVLGAAIGVLGAQMLAAHKHRKKEAAHRSALLEEQARARRSERMAEVGAMTGGLAHEIRNPLSTVGLNAALLREMIEDAGMEPEVKHRALKRLDALGRETDRLRDILEDFLQYAGRMNLSATPVNMVELLQELDDFFHPQCDQANVRCDLKVPGEPVMVTADAPLLKQALLNLMLNAVQVLDGKEGANLQLVLSTQDGFVKIQVRDNGPGIEQERLDTIFRPYWSSRAGGTGLGLPVTRRIVEAHHGEISVQSTLGEGTCFEIVLPDVPPGANDKNG